MLLNICWEAEIVPVIYSVDSRQISEVLSQFRINTLHKITDKQAVQLLIILVLQHHLSRTINHWIFFSVECHFLRNWSLSLSIKFPLLSSKLILTDILNLTNIFAFILRTAFTYYRKHVMHQGKAMWYCQFKYNERADLGGGGQDRMPFVLFKWLK